MFDGVSISLSNVLESMVVLSKSRTEIVCIIDEIPNVIELIVLMNLDEKLARRPFRSG